MKRIAWFPALLIIAACNNKEEQTVDVPAAVKDVFSASHPHATDVTWEAEDGNYEADYKTGEQKHTAVYSPAGKLLETETEIKPTELPVPVQATLESKYHGLEVKEAEKITLENGTRYEAEIDKGGQELEIILSEDGSIISEKSDADQNEKD